MGKLYVLHEMGSNSHYRALTYHAEHNKDLKVVFREFSVLKLTAKSIYKRDFKLFLKQFKNLASLFAFAFSSNKTIIIGIAPYDFRLLFYYPWLKRHNYYYHTSKTTWGYVNYSKRLFAKTKWSEKLWTRFINNASGVFCVTQVAASQIKLYYNPKAVQVVYHSVSDLYSSEVENRRNPTAVNCLFVGRLEESKGLELIFKIIEQLPESNFNFAFAGSGSWEVEVSEFCSSKRNCSFLGYIKNPHLYNEFAKSDILLAPSIKTGPWEELFGMVLIEAMSCRTLPMATDHTGPSEIIENGLSGHLFSETDFVDGAVSQLTLYAANSNLLRNSQDQAIKRAREFYPERIFARWNNLLQIKE